MRDILVAARPDQQHHDDRAAWICDRWFDAVLVHADPRLARFEETFRPRRRPRTPVLHTGFVVPQRPGGAPCWRPPGTPSILVSAGGGIVGGPLMRAALEAHARLEVKARPRLDLIAGPFLPEADWRELVERCAGRDDVRLERAVPDLAARMAAATLSVSQCGYNTAMDIVVAGVPALVVPYGAEHEDEQARRARRMQELGLLRVLESGELDAQRLARAMRETLVFRPRPNGLDLDGAARTTELLVELLRQDSQRVAAPCGEAVGS